MKTMKFAEHLVPLVLSGEKTSTWRLFDDKNIQVGDVLEAIRKDTGEAFGRMVITALKEKPLKDIKESDYVGHERFGSPEEMLEQYRKYYGDQVTPETLVKMLRFHFISNNLPPTPKSL